MMMHVVFIAVKVVVVIVTVQSNKYTSCRKIRKYIGQKPLCWWLLDASVQTAILHWPENVVEIIFWTWIINSANSFACIPWKLSTWLFFPYHFYSVPRVSHVNMFPHRSHCTIYSAIRCDQNILMNDRFYPVICYIHCCWWVQNNALRIFSQRVLT